MLEKNDSRNNVFVCIDSESKLSWGLDGYVRQRLRDENDREQKPVADLKRRKEAGGKKTDFPNDGLITYLTKHAEEIFEPKRILTDDDWLKHYREPDQFFETYKKARGSIVWISPTKNKLYLFMMDHSFSASNCEKYRKYAAAFFPGSVVQLIKQGDDVPSAYERKAMRTKVPDNFFRECKITCRSRGPN